MENRGVILAGLDPALEAKLRAALPELPVVPAPDSTPRRGAPSPLRAVAVVCVARDAESRFEQARELAGAGAHVIVVGPDRDADLILRALRTGAREYLGQDDIARIAHTIREQVNGTMGWDACRTILVFPAKGGVGSTTISTNLAGHLAREGHRVCLLDLDLTMGDTLAFLDLSGGHPISDVIANLNRMDRDLLETWQLKHKSGVHVLAQTEKLEDSGRVDGAGISRLLEFLRHHYDSIVIDGVHAFDDHAVAALDQANLILLVVSQEVPAVRRAQRCAALLRRLGHDANRVKLVVNRWTKSAEVSRDLVAQTVGLPVSATIASDYATVIHAINSGALLCEASPRSAVTKDIRSLLQLGQAESTVPTPHSASMLKRLFNPGVAHAHQ
jgi:pilus assembly protein CpaE